MVSVVFAKALNCRGGALETLPRSCGILPGHEGDDGGLVVNGDLCIQLRRATVAD